MPEEIKQKLIEEEMKESYIDYAMSVITSRALPDVRDGLKPVHRRILFAMNELGLQSNKQTKKSARIVGETLGKWHPHGDIAVYDALARMAQDFSLRYPLVIGQGNFGCFTRDTKIKLLDRTSKSFKELCETYKENEIFYVYSIDKNGNVVIGEAKNPRLTKNNSKIIEITLDTGEKIRCTPDHKFLLKNLKYKKAKDLTAEDSLMPGYFKLSPVRGNTELKDYLMIKDNKEDKYIFVHEISDKYNLERGVYASKDGPVRHHVDFDKFNNNPANLKRLNWKEHTKIHYNHINTLWKDKNFRKKQSEGVKLFYKNNPEHIEKKRIMLIERNKNKDFIKKHSEKRKEVWKNPELRQKISNKIKESFIKNPERKKFISEFSKKMWSDPQKRTEIISKMKKVMGSDDMKNKISKRYKEYLSQHPEFIVKKSKMLKEFYKNNPEAKMAISERSKKLWKDEKYRSKFINKDYNHLSAMAKKAWQNPRYREIQVNRVKRLWKDENFRNKIIKEVKQRNLERLQEKPNFMRDIAQKAAISHKINWKNKDYKNKVIKNKVLYYLNRLINQIGEENINENNYNKFKTNNCFPRFNNAIKYFKDINEMINLAKEYNHHIINIKFLDYTENVYDITVNEHHNFLLDCGIFVHNSIDGDSPAAQRYTEAKLSRIAEEILQDIDKETVNFIPNFDGSLKEPVVLPSKIPNLLINGSSGIAVGMATNIPPHNITEISEGIIAQINNPEITIQELMHYIKGPDFPTSAIICNPSGIKQIYETGKGKLIIKSKTQIEKDKIIITEIPYQLNKSSLLENIASLVRDEIIQDISDIRDESDREGIRIVIELKKNANANIVLNQLMKHGLQISYNVMMLALVNSIPKILTLKDLINEFIAFRKEVVTRRTNFELNKAEKRFHILEGLKIALNDIDNVVKLIKNSDSIENARNSLIKNLTLTIDQANAILDMKLQRLTSLEQEKLKKEQEELTKLIQELKTILSSEQNILEVIKKEIHEIRGKYEDKRKTQIIEDKEVIDEDLIQEEDVVIISTYSGYIKQLPLNVYKQQKRGGKGMIGTETKEEDIVEHLFVTSNLNTLLFFTNKGKLYFLKAYEIPSSGRYSKGKAIINLLDLEEDEKINAILPIKKFDNEHYLLFITKNGILKKTNLMEYAKQRNGIKAISLKDKDEVIDVKLTDNKSTFIIATKNGSAVKFNEKDVRNMGRNASGVRGIKLINDEVIGMGIAPENSAVLTVTENGYGKRTSINDYRLIKRGGKGVTNIITSERNGKVAAVKTVFDNDEIMLITKKGIIIRIPVKDISIVGRNTQGVRLMKLENDKVNAVARIEKE